IRNIEVESRPAECDSPPCPIVFTLTGELFNAGTKDITQATLGVGFVYVKAGEKYDSQSALPEKEEIVEVPGLLLKPCQQRPLKLVLDRPSPRPERGDFPQAT